MCRHWRYGWKQNASDDYPRQVLHGAPVAGAMFFSFAYVVCRSLDMNYDRVSAACSIAWDCFEMFLIAERV